MLTEADASSVSVELNIENQRVCDGSDPVMLVSLE